MHRADARGFSLVEMLVALAVFALAAVALLHLAAENTRAAVAASERVLAGVVADNLAVDAMLAPDASRLADAGEVAAGDVPWRWTREVAATAHSGLVRVDVAVFSPDGRLAAERRVVREAR
jgi:general secretion pathway protein I